MPTLVCPTCKKKFEESSTEHMPFCCRRCQLVDLGRWLGEEPSVPWLGSHDDADDGESYAG